MWIENFHFKNRNDSRPVNVASEKKKSEVKYIIVTSKPLLFQCWKTWNKLLRGFWCKKKKLRLSMISSTSSSTTSQFSHAQRWNSLNALTPKRNKLMQRAGYFGFFLYIKLFSDYVRHANSKRPEMNVKWEGIESSLRVAQVSIIELEVYKQISIAVLESWN